MNIPTIIRYVCDGRNAVWHVPFPYARESDVGASLSLADGTERQLAGGVDYTLSGQKLICVAPAGGRLAIWLKSDLQSAAEASARQALGGIATQCDDSPVAAVEKSAAVGAPAYEAEITADGVSNMLAERADAAVDAAQQRLADAAAAAVATVQKQIEYNLQAAVNEAGLYGQSSARCGALTLDRSYAQGSLLPLPAGLAYFPGRSSLQVFRNGKLLAPDADWQETGQEGAASQVIRLLNACGINDQLIFWIMPLTSAAEAELSARNAASAQSQAALHSSTALNAAKAAQAASDALDCCAANAEHYAGEAEKQAQNAHQQALNAWRSAVSASVRNKRPGIAVLKSLEEKTCMSTGFFIINPHITHSPSPFMGLWPVAGISDMQWDGVFLIGPQYPDCPKMPPHCPPHNVQQPDPNTAGDADDWLPDNHKHNAAGGTICSACAGNCVKQRQ